MEFLKEALGDELFGAVEEKLAGNENIKLANLASGGYVSREKYAALENENGANKKMLEEQNAKMTAFDEMKSAYDALKEKYDADTAGFAKKMAEAGKSHAIDMALMSRRAKNIKAAKALLDMDKIEYKDGVLSGFDEQIESVTADNEYLFGDEIKLSGGMRHLGKNQASHAFLQTIYENQAKRN